MRGAIFVLVLLAASGCVADRGSPAGTIGSTVGPGEGLVVEGRAVDAELVPVADVAVAGGDTVATTDANGTFRIGPFDAGTNVHLTATKTGYAPAEADVLVADPGPARVLLRLEAIASDVPYHQTIPHVAFIDCAWAGPPGSLPCNPIDRQLGTNFTNDQSQWYFKVPAPALAAMLHEATWSPSVFGRDMRFLLFHPDLVSGSAVGGSPYMDSRGGSPHREWLHVGKTAQGGSVAFNGNESFQYQALYRPWTTNSTIPGWGVALQQRVNNYYTFFYHRAGSEEFTVLPDQ